jgi:hypothetical protein
MTKEGLPPRCSEAQCSPHSLTTAEPPLLHQRARMPVSPLRGGKLYLLLCGRHQKACLLLYSAESPNTSHLASLQESPVSPKSWSPSSSTEWQSAILQVPGGQPPKVHSGPSLPTVPDHERALAPSLKSENARFPMMGGKL